MEASNFFHKNWILITHLCRRNWEIDEKRGLSIGSVSSDHRHALGNSRQWLSRFNLTRDSEKNREEQSKFYYLYRRHCLRWFFAKPRISKPLPARKFQAEGIRQGIFRRISTMDPSVVTYITLNSKPRSSVSVFCASSRETFREGKNTLNNDCYEDVSREGVGEKERRTHASHRKIENRSFLHSRQKFAGLNEKLANEWLSLRGSNAETPRDFPSWCIYLPQEISSSWLFVGFPFVERKRRKRGTPSLKHLSPDQCRFSFLFFVFPLPSF